MKVNVDPTQYAEAYDDYWSRHDRIESSSCDLKKFAQDVAAICGMGNVLDIGCGEGWLVGEFLKLGIDAKGVDVSNRVVARCNQRFPGRFTCASVLELPFEDGQFDTVVSTDCLEHLKPEDVPIALREIHRVAARFVFLQVATVQDRDGHWHLTVENRAWWEQRCFEAGFRKHPGYYKINDYEGLNRDGWQIAILLEKIPQAALTIYPLAEERDRHMDMMREVGEQSDARIIRYQWACDYIRHGDSVLDVACGLGYGSYVIRHLSEAKSVTGIDDAEYAIDYAKANFATLDPNLTYQQGFMPDFLRQFPDGSFDTIISFETLEHVQDSEALLNEFHRLLSPGGRVVVSVPNDWSDETGNGLSRFIFMFTPWID